MLFLLDINLTFEIKEDSEVFVQLAELELLVSNLILLLSSESFIIAEMRETLLEKFGRFSSLPSFSPLQVIIHSSLAC